VAGIYALCEVESREFAGTGANDEFWALGKARETGWPTIKLRYLRSYLGKPLTVERLQAERPGIYHLLLKRFQGSSFLIPADDFREVMTLLGEELEDLPSPASQCDITLDKLAALENEYREASPELKEGLSRAIERGDVGALVKKATGFRCQLCDALRLPSLGFVKANGEHYVEAHHVMPVSERQVGSLAASNVMILCANHHRQMHYGGIKVDIGPTTFDFVIDKISMTIPKFTATKSAVAIARG